jgi:hypothetical protein
MSRAQELTIQALESTIAGLREQVSGLRGELTGERRGESRVAAQLVADISAKTLSEDAHRRARDRAVGDMRRLLRVIAEHVDDERTTGSTSIELLVDAVVLAGFPLDWHLREVAVDRADEAARAHAGMSAAALTTAPVPPRTS